MAQRIETSGTLMKAWGVIGSVIILGVLAALAVSSSRAPGLPEGLSSPEEVGAVADSDIAGAISGAEEAQAADITPMRLSIESIGVDAPIESVGLTSNGHMAAPELIENAGWYRYGPAPGDPGRAVVAGHLDDARGKAGVFYRLGELKEGDLVTVSGADNKELTFKVVRTAVFDYDKAPLREIFGKGSKPMLNLITCGGTWLKDKKTYDKRLVVFAELVS